MKLNAIKLTRVYRKVDLSNGLKIVLIEAPTDGSWLEVDCYLNIYCIDIFDEIIWQIAAPVPKLSSDSFISFTLEGEVLKASRFFGGEFEVDIQTGVAKEIGWHK
jgi:hypothetical protein